MAELATAPSHISNSFIVCGCPLVSFRYKHTMKPAVAERPKMPESARNALQSMYATEIGQRYVSSECALWLFGDGMASDLVTLK